ncbi:hypothetical protein MTP99_005238 [Tenebrio molitor]|nr:hypothetical protein MTP99_005238 [Tenebrio molitor]
MRKKIGSPRVTYIGQSAAVAAAGTAVEMRRVAHSPNDFRLVTATRVDASSANGQNRSGFHPRKYARPEKTHRSELGMGKNVFRFGRTRCGGGG